MAQGVTTTCSVDNQRIEQAANQRLDGRLAERNIVL